MGKNRRRLIALVLGGITLAAALFGCGGHKSADAAKASAAATSSAVVQGKQDARQYFGKCVPASSAAQVKLVASLGTKAGREGLMQCAGIPKQDRQAAASCALGNAEKAGKLPKGAGAKLDALLNDAYPCAARYRAAGPANTAANAPVTPSASAK